MTTTSSQKGNPMTDYTPRQHDEALAAIWADIYKVQRQRDLNANTLLRLAGAEFYYRGRQRVTDMTAAEAAEIVQERLAQADNYLLDHAQPPSESGYVGTDWTNYNLSLAPYDIENARTALDKRAEYADELDDLQAEADELEATYTGWSRFFLVTSSTGHIHSSMACSTCRPTTTFGWLPGLSGKTEEDAVAEHGPALCSVCFPSAPVEWTAEKITAARAARAAA